MDIAKGTAIQAGFLAKKIDLVVVHVAEGQGADVQSKTEFTLLKSWGLLGPKTAVVHGVALTSADFQTMASNGTALIWSPRSNFELYRQTTDLTVAVANHVVVALAPDWAPTGSSNMLAELNYASGVVEAEFANLLSAKQLFEMTTAVPARLAHIDDKVGSLEPGHYADLFLLHGDPSDPYRALAQASPLDVELVFVNGQPVYGTTDLLHAAGASNLESITVCSEARYLNSAALSTRYKDVLANLDRSNPSLGVSSRSIVECRH
jgi:cytosine/adenosine deaminase-related metal-dependent hydrolase